VTTSCYICLGGVTGGETYHSKCVESLFGTKTFPAFHIELSKLYTLAATKMAGKMSISGAQEKVSLTLSADRKVLEVTSTGGRYILKPETSRFTSVPQNEQLSMLMAQVVGIEVPPFGLVRFQDGATAYIIKRFDRLEDGLKLQVEDFCQLAEKRPRDKYDGSAELCVRIVRRFATEPLVEVQKLYRLILFSWWIQNGDMHLKNFSLLTTPDGIRKLSPAYDLLCTKLVIPDDRLAMPIGGRDKNFTKRKWLEFAEYCEIPEKAATRLITKQIDALEPSLKLISASLLHNEMKEQYESIIQENTAILST
jgi:serine/threonine-protein kinase HipA